MLPNDTNVSSQPLFAWFDQNKDNRAMLRAAGYSDGRITNWKRRGIPIGQVGRIAAYMGISYEEYVRLAEEAALRGKGWRPAVVLAFIFALLQAPDGNASHNALASGNFFAKSLTEIHIRRLRFLPWLFRHMQSLFRSQRPLWDI